MAYDVRSLTEAQLDAMEPRDHVIEAGRFAAVFSATATYAGTPVWLMMADLHLRFAEIKMKGV